jgi:hypothetical protein
MSWYVGRIVRQPPIAFLYASRGQRARLLRRAIAGVGLLVVLIAVLALLTTLVPPGVYRKDFVQEYVLARAVAERQNPYAPVDELVVRYFGAPLPGWSFEHPTPHPPPVALLFLPMSFLDYVSAVRVWLVLQLACVAVSVWLLARIAGKKLSPRAVCAATLVLVAWYPLQAELRLGQLTVLLLVGLATARLLLLMGRPYLGGAILGLTLLVKPVLWPVLLLLMLRRIWGAVAAAVLIVLVGYALSTWVIGIDRVYAYFTQVLPIENALYRNSGRNLSLWTVGWRLFGGTNDGVEIVPVVPSTLAAVIVSVAFPMAVLFIVTIWASRRRDLDSALCLMVCVSLLVSPILWTQYLILQLIPAAYVVRRLLVRNLPLRETAAGLAVGALLLIPFTWWSALADFLSGKPLSAASLVLSVVPASIGIGFGQSPSAGSSVLAFLPSWLTLGPSFGVALLGGLVSVGSDVDTPGEVACRCRRCRSRARDQLLGTAVVPTQDLDSP